MSETHERKTKLQALMSLGDLGIYAGIPFCQLYLHDTLKILETAGQLSLRTQDYQNDPDILEYLADLRTNVIDCYVTMNAAVQEANLQQVFS